MSEGKKFKDAADAMTFIQAGNATVTIVSKVTEKRFTYRVRESEDGRVFGSRPSRGFTRSCSTASSPTPSRFGMKAAAAAAAAS